jgi:predicted O-methyltransferase YrrM
MTPIEELFSKYPFPSHLPGVAGNDGPDWNQQAKVNALGAIVPRDAKVLMEVGCFLGRSTRGIANLAPNAKMICIDHWLGSIEHHQNPSDQKYLPTLFETFIVNCWGYRDRFSIIRENSANGQEIVKNFGVTPDFIFIDGAHDYTSVLQDLTMASTFFPGAIIAGDDFQWDSVRDAVRSFEKNSGKQIKELPESLFYFKN